MFYTPTDDSILEGYQNAKAVYASLGLDTERALAQFEKVGISIHSWAGDDVTGFETHEGGVHSENTVTGNYPGRARNGGELRQDLEQAMRFPPAHTGWVCRACMQNPKRRRSAATTTLRISAIGSTSRKSITWRSITTSPILRTR